MSGSASQQSPAITYGPTALTSATSFQSPDVASGSTSSFGGLGSYPGGASSGSFRMKNDSPQYSFDEQAPRSQQPHNYTHQDMSHVGGLAHTQALGAAAPQYGSGSESSRTPVSGHFFPQHTRHTSLASSIGQLGLSPGDAGQVSDVTGGTFQNYGAYSEQRTGLAGANPSSSDISPTRSRFPAAGLHDTRQVVRSQPGRPIGLGVGIGGDSSSPKIRGYGALPESSNSPRSLKRAAEHLDDPRSSMDHPNQLRRPASFPVINAGGMPYGRPAPMDPRSAQTLGRRGGRPGQTTPGRTNMMLPGTFGVEEGRRDSFGSSQTMPSPFVGSSASSEELPTPYSMGSFPQLVRSTQIPGSSSTGVGTSLGTSDPAYSPPSMVDAPKARLELHGNLNDMAVGWSHDEWRSGRRLVQFWRRQEGSVIHATWRPITPSQYVPNSIVISCIFRDEKNECFVTSVDTIYLLEALVASRFTVEEKNRIRRNLEGFRPITVSKSKRECDAFFKRIMSFPNPKPRNIEKDVKVFPWKVLSSALCKIISKYSPLYESSGMLMAPDQQQQQQQQQQQWAPEMSGAQPQIMASTGYRESDYGPTPSSAPNFRDGQYDRQAYPGGGMYGAGQHPGGPSSSYAPLYGSAAPTSDFHSRSRSTGSTFTFQELMPGGQAGGSGGNMGLGGYQATSGSAGAIPFPSQGTPTTEYAQQQYQQPQHHQQSGGPTAGYDVFPGSSGGDGSGIGSAGGSVTPSGSNSAGAVSSLYEASGQQLQGSQMQEPARSASSGHHRDMSGSTLAGAAGHYSSERRT